MLKYLFSNLIIASFCLITVQSQDESSNIKKLREELFTKRKYDLYSRPVMNHTKPVNICFWIKILKIIDLDIKTGLFTVNAFVHMLWNDEHLSWNPNDFGGQKELIISSDMVWKPDICIINGPDFGRFKDIFRESTLWLRSNGDIEWMPQVLFKTYCTLDIKYYPNDVQICRLKMESYMHQIKYVDFTHLPNSTVYINPRSRYLNNEWKVIKIEGKKKNITYVSYGTYASIICYITIERRDNLLYYFIKMPIIVSILFSVLSMIFPPNSKKRFILIGWALIILSLVLLFIATMLGFSGNKGIPIIVSSVSTTTILISLLVFWSSLINNVITKWSIHSRPLPPFFSIILSNPVIKLIGVGNYFIDMSFREGLISGITIGKDKSLLTGSENEWILLGLLSDRFIFFAYLIYLLAIYA